MLEQICRYVYDLCYQEKYEFISQKTALAIYNQDKIKVELRYEPSQQHHKPHIHIKHIDEIDASICLNTFEKIAGKIPDKKLKKLKQKLLPFQNELLDIWNDLNEKNDEVSAVLKISRLRIPRIKLQIYHRGRKISHTSPKIFKCSLEKIKK